MKSSERFLVILNPTAAKGHAGRRRPELESLLAASGIDYELRLTERPGHAAELARSAGTLGFGAVVSGGGDGTANEVVNGLMRAAAEGGPVPAMGVLSIGRGNDFAYGADVPVTLGACVAALAKGARRPMDVGLVTGGDYPQGKYFCNGIGIGFDTTVGLEAAKMKRVHGFMAYVFGAVRSFVNYLDAPQVTISYDGIKVERKSHQISVMNGKRMGGAFYMAPNAKNYDGLLDICISGEANRLELVGIIAKYSRGAQENDKRFVCARSARYEIDAPAGGLIVHADGETVCVDGTRLVIECLPGRLTAIYDPEISR